MSKTKALGNARWKENKVMETHVLRDNTSKWSVWLLQNKFARNTKWRCVWFVRIAHSDLAHMMETRTEMCSLREAKAQARAIFDARDEPKEKEWV